MKKGFFFVLSLFLLSSCVMYEDLDFKGVEGMKLGKLEGKKLTINFGVKVDNPNGYSIKVKPSMVDLFVDEELIGKIVLSQAVKIIRKKEDTYYIPLQIDLVDGALLKFFKYTLREKVNLRIKGKVKGSVLGISKKIDVDEVKELDGKLFKLESLMGK